MTLCKDKRFGVAVLGDRSRFKLVRALTIRDTLSLVRRFRQMSLGRVPPVHPQDEALGHGQTNKQEIHQ